MRGISVGFGVPPKYWGVNYTETPAYAVLEFYVRIGVVAFFHTYPFVVAQPVQEKQQEVPPCQPQ